MGAMAATQLFLKGPEGVGNHLGEGSASYEEESLACMVLLARVSSMDPPSPSFAVWDAGVRREKAPDQTTLIMEALACGGNASSEPGRAGFKYQRHAFLPPCPGCPTHLASVSSLQNGGQRHLFLGVVSPKQHLTVPDARDTQRPSPPFAFPFLLTPSLWEIGNRPLQGLGD